MIALIIVCLTPKDTASIIPLSAATIHGEARWYSDGFYTHRYLCSVFGNNVRTGGHGRSRCNKEDAKEEEEEEEEYVTMSVTVLQMGMHHK